MGFRISSWSSRAPVELLELVVDGCPDFLLEL
jgi:hypothetical protein